MWRWFVDVAQASALPDDGKPIDADWALPRFEAVQPLDDEAASLMRMRIGKSSWEDEVSADGKDPDDVFDKIVDWNAKFDAKGVILDCDPRHTAKSGAMQTSAPALHSAAMTAVGRRHEPRGVPADGGDEDPNDRRLSNMRGAARISATSARTCTTGPRRGRTGWRLSGMPDLRHAPLHAGRHADRAGLVGRWRLARRQASGGAAGRGRTEEAARLFAAEEG